MTRNREDRKEVTTDFLGYAPWIVFTAGVIVVVWLTLAWMEVRS